MASVRDRKILLVTAVDVEKEAVLRGLHKGAGAAAAERFTVIAGGVGPAMAAASTAAALACGDYALVISAGIGGGFAHAGAAVGSLVVASAMIAADLGAETAEGFLSVDELGFGSARVAADAALAPSLTAALRAGGLAVVHGPIVTVSTATGTAETAAVLAARYPGAAAEAMEGYGAAVAARMHGIPAIELRAVSNAVGPRDRSAWRIPEALAALEEACAIIQEVLAP